MPSRSCARARTHTHTHARARAHTHQHKSSIIRERSFPHIILQHFAALAFHIILQHCAHHFTALRSLVKRFTSFSRLSRFIPFAAFYRIFRKFYRIFRKFYSLSKPLRAAFPSTSPPFDTILQPFTVFYGPSRPFTRLFASFYSPKTRFAPFYSVILQP